MNGPVFCETLDGRKYSLWFSDYYGPCGAGYYLIAKSNNKSIGGMCWSDTERSRALSQLMADHFEDYTPEEYDRFCHQRNAKRLKAAIRTPWVVKGMGLRSVDPPERLAVGFLFARIDELADIFFDGQNGTFERVRDLRDSLRRYSYSLEIKDIDAEFRADMVKELMLIKNEKDANGSAKALVDEIVGYLSTETKEA